jgi:hypothetical protein
MKPNKTALFILAIVFIASCSKEYDGPMKSDELLTASAWIPISQTISPELILLGDTIRDLLQNNCSKDNYTVFNSNGSGYVDEGPTKCKSFDPQRSTFYWHIASDLVQTYLVLSKDSNFSQLLGDFTIIQLNEQTLIYERVVDGKDIGGKKGVYYTVTETYKH